MAMKKDGKIKMERYLNRRTLILGDVNSGKTTLTHTIIDTFRKSGQSDRMVILDLAPDEIRGVGGKLALAQVEPCMLLTCPIIPPRLTGRNEDEVQSLARRNAAAIDILIDQAMAADRSILLVNDASLYLQAGPLERLLAVIACHATVVINAYYGVKFAPTAFSLRERQQVENLARQCDHVIHLEKPVQ